MRPSLPLLLRLLATFTTGSAFAALTVLAFFSAPAFTVARRSR